MLSVRYDDRRAEMDITLTKHRKSDEAPEDLILIVFFILRGQTFKSVFHGVS